jgi:hypothetical protein
MRPVESGCGVFSRKEREFLKLLTEGSDNELSNELMAQFPNPGYRRRLLWTIRRKAAAAARDWALYSQAADRENRVLPAPDRSEEPPVPRYTEPLAALVERLSSRRIRQPAAGSPPTRRSDE